MTTGKDKGGDFQSAEVVKTGEGRQYHLQTAPGDVAPFILLCGDPDRAERTAKYFDEVKCENRYREYVTITGTFQGVPVSVCGTGIGADNTEIAVIELSQCIDGPTFIRIGTSGALPSHVRIAELVVTTGAVRLENTSLYFVPEGYPAVSHPDVVIALAQAASEEGFTYHAGLTATASGFYGAQARNVPGFPPRFPELPSTLEKLKVLNFEMEASTLLTLSTLRGLRAGVVSTVFASRYHNRFISLDQKLEAEDRCIRTGLRAVVNLDRMDKEKGDRPLWHPGI